MYRELLQTERDAKDISLELLRVTHVVIERTKELLKLRGMLSMRGIFDYVESEAMLTKPEWRKLSRSEKWANILDEKPSLRD